MSDLKRVIVFGDSLQDNGNFFKKAKFPDSPYYDGRFSDGKVSPEILADMIAKHQDTSVDLKNFAIGGALTSGKNPKSLLKPYSFSVSDQLDIFISEYQKIDEDDLVVINGGGNNFLFALHDEKPYINFNAVMRCADDLGEIVEESIKIGAKNIILWNIPDITFIPAFKKIPLPRILIKIYKAYLKSQIKKQNNKIKLFLENIKMKYSHVNIECFDAYDLFNKVIDAPLAYGFEDSQVSCVDSFGGADAKGNIQHDLKIDHDPSTHLFWDFAHPTSKGSKVIAEQMFNQWYRL